MRAAVTIEVQRVQATDSIDMAIDRDEDDEEDEIPEEIEDKDEYEKVLPDDE